MNQSRTTAGVSVLILTKNEEKDLPGCLASVAWSDDIHVYDSESTDNTQAIARRAGATVTVRRFDNWSAHQNWGLRNLPFKHPWVFYIDADERMTSELVDNVQRVVAHDEGASAFRVRRRDFLFNTWLKHVQASPYYVRLFRPAAIHYERLVNPITVVSGRTDNIDGYLDHYPFSKGISHWFERHNSYSALEAEQIRRNMEHSTPVSFRQAFFAKDFAVRRAQQKELFYTLPARPLLKFLLLYVAKRGFLDGKAGLTYATLQAIYEYMIILKHNELTERHP